MAIPLCNDTQGYGLVGIGLHWLMAVLIAIVYPIGTLIVDMDYTDPWYRSGPELHLGLGAVTGLLLCLRLGWRLANPPPEALGPAWERRIASWVHRAFYALIAATVVTGYLITTADGKALAVFGWIEIPATVHGYANQEDLAGVAHAWLADLLVGLVAVHGLAALKHHFIDHDPTLRRILIPGRAGSPPQPPPVTKGDPP